MAGDILLAPLLLGLGVDELSTGAALVPRVKRAVQSLDIAACLKLIEDVKHDDNGVGHDSGSHSGGDGDPRCRLDDGGAR